jgi:hypothetical protein
MVEGRPCGKVRDDDGHGLGSVGVFHGDTDVDGHGNVFLSVRLNADTYGVPVRFAVFIVEGHVCVESRFRVEDPACIPARFDAGMRIKIPEFKPGCFGRFEINTRVSRQIGERCGTAVNIMHERRVPNYGQIFMPVCLRRSHVCIRQTDRISAFFENSRKFCRIFRDDFLFAMFGLKRDPFGRIGSSRVDMVEHGEERFFRGRCGVIHRAPTCIIGKIGNVSSGCSCVHDVPP